MLLSINLSDSDAALFQDYANERNISVAEAMLQSMRKSVHNAAYLAKLELAREQVKQGHVVFKTMDELEEMANG